MDRSRVERKASLGKWTLGSPILAPLRGRQEHNPNRALASPLRGARPLTTGADPLGRGQLVLSARRMHYQVRGTRRRFRRAPLVELIVRRSAG